MDISIIIVNYNTYNLLIDCIQSINKFTSNVKYEIIIIDNNSPDRSIENIKNKFPEITLINHNVNAGFGIANNIGAQIAKGKYLFFLNPDTIFLNDSLGIFLDFANKNYNQLNIGVLGSILLDVNHNVNASYSTSFGDYYKYISHFIKQYIGIKPNKELSDNSLYKKVCWVSGANMFIYSELFFEIGSFDSNFFMYFEDEEIQRRLVVKGFNNYIIQGPKIIHLEGSGIKEYPIKKRKIIEESKIYYYKKYSNSKILFSIQYFIYRNLVVYKILKSEGVKKAKLYNNFLKALRKKY